MRVWRFSKHNVLITGAILLTTLGQLALVFVYTVKAFSLSSIREVSQLRVLGTVSLAVGVVTDVLIAISLCYFLRSFRTGHRASDTLVNTLSRYAVNTGALTSAVSLSTVVLYNAMPNDNFIFVGLYFVLSKLYSVSFLATLNTRRIIRGKGTDQSYALSSVSGGPSLAATALGRARDWDSQASYAPGPKQSSGALPLPSNAYLEPRTTAFNLHLPTTTTESNQHQKIP
ncbi:hypothetical protein HGRIS_006154 [Hohenbuehelia grisea]|uniref:DUF6534 domain-containing protein n=1 Tax=Hohenbuehelia grisea TaxID=104357 RepID=A0ABR3JZA6_9AGAR